MSKERRCCGNCQYLDGTLCLYFDVHRLPFWFSENTEQPYSLATTSGENCAVFMSRSQWRHEVFNTLGAGAERL